MPCIFIILVGIVCSTCFTLLSFLSSSLFNQFPAEHKSINWIEKWPDMGRVGVRAKF